MSWGPAVDVLSPDASLHDCRSEAVVPILPLCASGCQNHLTKLEQDMNNIERHLEVPVSIHIYSQATINCHTYHAVFRVLETSKIFHNRFYA